VDSVGRWASAPTRPRASEEKRVICILSLVW
jgi:hypothetical protein